jgi:hypothetical protein
MVLTGNGICACQVLQRPILTLEADLEIFDEMLKPLLDSNSNKTVIQHVFNLDDNSPIKKKSRINLDQRKIYILL